MVTSATERPQVGVKTRLAASAGPTRAVLDPLSWTSREGLRTLRLDPRSTQTADRDLRLS